MPNGSFVQVVSAGSGPVVEAPLRSLPGNLIRDGAPIDHISLFGEISDTAGVALTVRFEDPDGRHLEVTAYPD